MESLWFIVLPFSSQAEPSEQQRSVVFLFSEIWRGMGFYFARQQNNVLRNHLALFMNEKKKSLI